MALLKDVQDTTLQIYTYHKVANVRINTYTSSVSFDLHSFKDQNARNAGAVPTISGAFGFSWEPNQLVIEQAYIHLKTIEAFQNAVDC